MVSQGIVHNNHKSHQFSGYEIERSVLSPDKSSISDVFDFISANQQNKDMNS